MSSITTSKRTALSKKQAIITGLILLLGLAFGLAASVLIVRQEWLWLFALALLVPALVLAIVYPFISVLVWLLVFPFFLKEFMPGARYMFWLVHRMIIPATLGLLIIQNMIGMRKHKPFRLGWVDWAMIAFLLLSLLNIYLLTEQPLDQLIRFYDRIFVPFCLFWLVRLIAPKDRDIWWLAPVALFIIFTQGTFGLLSWFAPGLLPAGWLTRIGERTTGTFGNPAVFSITLTFCAIILLQVARTTRSAAIRYVALTGMGIAFFFIFFSFSRGSWLAALVVLIGMFFSDPRTMLKLSLVGGLLAAILLVFTPLSEFTNYAGQRLIVVSTAEGRVISGAASFEMIRTRPLTGWGYGGYDLYDEQFRHRVFDLATREEQTSHNTYLLITAEMGLPGLVFYFFPAFWLLIRSVRYKRSLPVEGMLSKSLLFMLWLIIVEHLIAGAFTDLIQSNFFNTGIWWLSLGLIAIIVETGEDAVKNQVPSQTAR